MQLGSPFDALHEAMASAIHKDLDDIVYQDRDWEAYKNDPKHPDIRVTKTRRPTTYDVEILVFSQLWGSTALGYGGMGGASMTPAYTIVVFNFNEYCIYFGGGWLAYKINIRDLTEESRNEFLNDLRNWNMPSKQKVGKYKYKKEKNE